MGIFGRRRSGDLVRATARVVSSSQPPPHATYSPLKMDLVVQADGLEPTAVAFNQRVARCSKFPLPGQTIPVEIRLADPTSVKVVWDEVPTRGQMGQQQSQAIAETMRGGAAPTRPVAGDPIASLERLAQLHRSGVLSDEEFAAAKARILDEG